MPCNSARLTQMQEARKAQALKDLEQQLADERVKLVRNRDGSITFAGWETDRENPGHWHDDCAYRTLMAEGSSALRMAIARMPEGSTNTREQLR